MEAVIDLIIKGSLNIDRLITKECHINDASKAYDLLKSQKALGVVLNYLPKNDFEFVPATREIDLEKSIKFVPAKKGELQVGIVGAGGFAKAKLLPLVSKIPGVKIKAVADVDVTNAENVSRTYGATKTFVEEQDLFEEDSVDVVLIASPHKFHSDQAVQALCAGKAVFMEKPMVTTFDQFKKVSTFLKDNPKAPFCVDYNRSFAPFVQKIKWETVDRYSPLVVTYRMNAGYIPPEHWVQREIGAGRVIGEACHIFDLFCFLTGSAPRTVSVEALRPSSDDLFPTDNFSVQISFADGSICSLVYTSIGHTALGKERMELFFDSKSIVMDDYLTLRGYGTSHSFNETVSIADKGHNNLIKRFFEGIKQDEYEAPISVDRLNTVAELTLIIDQLVCQGGGEKDMTLS
jgi:predicted dehydrogenase